MSEPGHNVEADRRDYEDQRFLNALAKVKGLNSEKAENAAAYKLVYDSLKDLGFTKQDVKFALELEEKDARQVIDTMARRIRIAKLLGHGLSRQFEMFDEDRTPIDERAYEEGLAAGKKRESATNPYDLSTEAGQKWQEGMNDGTAWINRDLAEQFEAAHGGANPFPDGDDDSGSNVVPMNAAE